MTHIHPRAVDGWNVTSLFGNSVDIYGQSGKDPELPPMSWI